jgi:alpha-L-fucosidase
VKTLVHLLVKAAGYDANLLLNIGPMPNGAIQQEFSDTLKKIGEWTGKNGETVYGTRGGLVSPKDWGTVTVKNNTLYLHILNAPRDQPYIFIPGLKKQVASASLFTNKAKVKFKQQPEGLFVYLDGISFDDIDTIIQLDTK